MDDLDAWVAERQAELDALLRDRPDLYMGARRRFQQEYEAKQREKPTDAPGM